MPETPEQAARRARLIAVEVTLRRADILEALEGIARTQVACEHEFNPWILGGWWDKTDVRVCGKCGFTEHRAAHPTNGESGG